MKKTILITLLTITSSITYARLELEPYGDTDGSSIRSQYIAREKMGPEICRPQDVQEEGFRLIYNIGSSQSTAKDEIVKLAMVSSTIDQKDPKAAQKLKVVMLLIRKAYDMRAESVTEKMFVTAFTDIDHLSLGCDTLQNYNNAVSYYMKTYRPR